ncbi:hypothetical protein ETU08_04360 [Apibacter muscae]|uniref:EpsG family protein n=1 Tax=Apibacter muscae TaxID=2509004 RepID=A0A563DFN5_9FLAO|nr:hypothetical protein [Apibacter muscae]TWP29088.1 hypothetical protein ETU09_04400 [Apibacter muscae]TWP30331.1 hypothetical protein ETU08_04360 [Apibacter muscae]
MWKVFKVNNPEYYIILFFSLFYYLYELKEHTPLSFNYQYFLYDYNFGFIKRGLIGQLLNLTSISLTIETFIKISTLLLFLVAILLVKIIDTVNFKNKFLGYFLICFLVVSPSLIKNLWYDLGRLDIFGILYCLIFLLPLNKKIIDICFIISPMVIFIHEGFLLLWLPSYFVCWLIASDSKINKKNLSIFSVFIFFSLLSILINMFFGKLTINFQVFENYIINKSNGGVDIEKTVLSNKVYNEMRNSMINNFSHKKFWIFGIINVITISYVIKLFFVILNINKFYFNFIFIPIFFTFLMFFLGLDALRWFSNMCFSLYIIFLSILFKNRNKIRGYEFKTEDQNKFYFLLFILLIMIPFTKLGYQIDF